MARTHDRLGQLSRSEKLTRPDAPQKIDGRVAGDARQPVRGLVQILQLILPLQRFDERFLGEILRVGDVAHDAIDQQEHAAHVLGHKPALLLRGERSRVVSGGAGRFAHLCSKSTGSALIADLGTTRPTYR